MLAICAFYLYDACLPLAANAGLVRRAGRARGYGWQARWATDGFEVRSAYLAWPALLLPHQPVYLLRWNPGRIDLPGDIAALKHIQAHAASFQRFMLPLYGLGATLFVLLPIALFVWPSEAVQLSAAAMIYLFAGWIAVHAWRRAGMGHTPQSVARSVAVQCLLCPPFAMNAVRKLSTAYTPEVDLLQAAQHLLPAPAWQSFAEHAQIIVKTELDAAQADGHTAQAQRLQTSLHTLRIHASPAANSPRTT